MVSIPHAFIRSTAQLRAPKYGLPPDARSAGLGRRAGRTQGHAPCHRMPAGADQTPSRPALPHRRRRQPRGRQPRRTRRPGGAAGAGRTRAFSRRAAAGRAQVAAVGVRCLRARHPQRRLGQCVSRSHGLRPAGGDAPTSAATPKWCAATNSARIVPFGDVRRPAAGAGRRAQQELGPQRDPRLRRANQWDKRVAQLLQAFRSHPASRRQPNRSLRSNDVPAWFARSVYRAQEAAMHRPTFAMLAELERTQWLSREGIEAYRRSASISCWPARWRTAPGTRPAACGRAGRSRVRAGA